MNGLNLPTGNNNIAFEGTVLSENSTTRASPSRVNFRFFFNIGNQDTNIKSMIKSMYNELAQIVKWLQHTKNPLYICFY